MSEIKLTRTVALVGHGGSGKTTLSETFLYNSGIVDRLGKVDEQTATTDFEPEETKRGSSVSSAFGHYIYKKHSIHFIDTPGDDNFLSDTSAALRAVDGVIMVADAIDGIKVQGEKVWQFVHQNKLPTMVVINKMDRDRAELKKALDMISTMLSMKLIELQIPIRKNGEFIGIIDLLSNKAFTFQKDDSGTMTNCDIPDELRDEVDKSRERMIEDITEVDDELVERYLEGDQIENEELFSALAKGVQERSFLPVTICSAYYNMGSHFIMDMINKLLPSPIKTKKVEILNTKTDTLEQCDFNLKKSLVALVFKTITDPFAGQLSMIRIFSGTLKTDTQLFNPNRNLKERFGQILKMTGKNQESILEASPGDLIAIPKLKGTKTGDTLCDILNPLKLTPIEPLPAVISYAIEAKEKGDEERLFVGINKLLEEDPTLRLERDPQTNEALLSGMGAVHIETTLEKLKRKFSVEVTLKTPKVPYRETIKSSTRVQGRYKKQTGGRGQFGDTWLEISPAKAGEGFVFVNKIVGGAIPRQYIPAVEKGIKEAMQFGVIAGYPMVDIKVELVDGSFHPVDSSEMAFKIAGSLGFKKGSASCKLILLEPIMKLTVFISEEFMGDVMGDISGKRGRVLGMGTEGTSQVIKATVPMAEILNYQPELTSMTGGRGTFTVELSHYDEVPGDVQAKIVEKYQKTKGESN